MSGISGFTGALPQGKKIIKDMVESIRHRGPDRDAVYLDDFMTIGFCGLSVAGISDGDQPVYNEDGNLLAFMDGTIYNFRELREDLKAKGHIFGTDTDAEVIVHLYEEYGAQMMDKLRGVFVIFVYEKNTGKLFAARDHFGMKPFYYTECNEDIIFGSEIKSFFKHPGFSPEVNLCALETYLSFQCSSLDESFFKGVYKLPPGHYMVYESGKVSLTRYFTPSFMGPASYSSIEAAADEIDSAVQTSTEMHLIGDTEIGAFLSGGVDSSYIAASSGARKTFTVGFEFEKYSEIDLAKTLSDSIGAENICKTITDAEYWDILPKVQYHMDEPLADPATIALYFGAEAAAEHVKVTMSGEGSDEFFGGYNIYKEPLDLRPVTGLPRPLRTFLGKVAAALPFKVKGRGYLIRGSRDVEERFIGNANIFSVAERREILKSPSSAPTPQEITAPLYRDVESLDDITKMQYIDINLWLVNDILLNLDRMCMAHSLDVRAPLLDKEIFAIAAKLPTEYRVNKGATKAAFRVAANRRLPAEVANRKKLGFPVPIRVWLREEHYYNKVRESFTSTSAELFFNTGKLVGLLDAHRSGKSDESRKIWTVYMFLIWYEQFFS